MAIMYPSKLPDDVLRDPKRAAECRVYDELRKQLDADYHVFYSSPWLGTRPDGSEVEGEADFIVAHQKIGMLVIEVKGGRITIDSDGQWRSKNREEITFKIKNPVKQARDSKHALTKKLKNSPVWKSGWINHRHGVILNDVSRPELERDLRPDMPLRLFAFREDMSFLDKWVVSRFAVAEEDDIDTTSGSPFGVDGINVLVDLVARPIQLQMKLSTDIDQDINRIDLLTTQQVWILKDLAANKRMTIAGAAGTGKTIMAVHKAMDLAKTDGKRVLLLCFNRPLAERLAEMVAIFPTIKAVNFHQFCRECVSAAGQSVPDDDKQLEIQMGDRLAENLVDVFADAGIDQYDAVIIDEGQDFKDSWIASLELVVKDGDEGVLYIFYDDNQNVMSRSGGYIKSLAVSKWHLSRNFRNTRAVFKEADKYYQGEIVTPIGPPGVPVGLYPVQNEKDLKLCLSERIGELIKNEGVRPEDIAVLVPDMSTVELLGSTNRIGRYRVAKANQRVPDRVVLDTVRRFKGLESPVVLLVLTSGMRGDADIMYTGITRSQSVLDIIGPPRMIDLLRV